MPFWKSAKIELENSKDSTSNICINYMIEENNYARSNTGYLSSSITYHSADLKLGYLEYLNVQNQVGHIVAMVVHLDNVFRDQGFVDIFESDILIYVNGIKCASVTSTGKYCTFW